MKLQDLETGQEYLLSTSNDWLSDGWRDGIRVRVVDLGRWSASWGYGSRDGETHEVTSSTGATFTVRRGIRPTVQGRADGVLCLRLDPETGEAMERAEGKPYYTVEATRYLRGPWTEARAAQEERRREKAEARDRRVREERAIQERIAAAAKALGVESRPRYSVANGLHITIEDAEALVARLNGDQR